VEAVARIQAKENRNLVRSPYRPAEFVEAAQHALRPFSAVLPDAHFLHARRSRLIAGAHLDAHTRRSNRDKVVLDHLAPAAEDNPKWSRSVAEVHIGQAEVVAVRVDVHSGHTSDNGAGDDHRAYVWITGHSL
jgi:hypothetical protein